LKVTVVWATPRIQDVASVDLPEGATVADAVAQSGFAMHYGLDPAALGFAIFGERAGANAPLADGDRVELTRPLVADPKAARARQARATPAAKPVRRIRRRHGA
jgi:putative ubiquitin-RnfH superfamily antitoxin RatB of RatAB toxin-antitoxin module